MLSVRGARTPRPGAGGPERVAVGVRLSVQDALRKRDAIRRLKRAESELERAKEEFLYSHGWRQDDEDLWLDPIGPNSDLNRYDVDDAVWHQRQRLAAEKRTSG